MSGTRQSRKGSGMKITMIEPDGDGGLIHFAYELCTALADEGHSVKLVTSTSYELGNLPHRFEVSPTMRLWARNSGDGKWGRWRILRALRRAYRGGVLTVEWARVAMRLAGEKPDVVIFSEILHPHLAFAPLLLRRWNVVTSQICHEYKDLDAKGNFLTRRIAKFLYSQFDHVFFLSSAAREAFLADAFGQRERSSTMPHGSQTLFSGSDFNGDDARRALGLADDVPVLLYFGYIRPSKGYEELLRAFAVSRSRDSVRLVIAGRPTKFVDPEALQRLIAELGIERSVSLHTQYIPNEQVVGFIDMSRALVLPYRKASQSGVLHLAYGQSKPVIATNVGGLKEDVIDNESGLLVPPNDIPALSNAIDELMGAPERAREMGIKAKKLSETRFTWQAAAKNFVEAVRPYLSR